MDICITLTLELRNRDSGGWCTTPGLIYCVYYASAYFSYRILWSQEVQYRAVNVVSTLEKGQLSVNGWGNNLLAVGGELRPDKCSYTVHRMQPTKSGEWEYIKDKLVKRTEKSDEDQEELDDLWEDMDDNELDDLDVADAPFTVPLIGGDAATIKRLANDESVTNLGL